MKEYSFTSDLIADDIRCKIKNINKEGEERYITVWNIKGERRSQVLEELKEITELTEDDTEIFNRFYVGLILEFTDLVLDILADDKGKIMDIENVASGGSLSVNEPEVVSIKAKLED